MPPIDSSPSIHRIVIYHQTHHYPDGTPLSILPLITQQNIFVTHVNIAAIHLCDPPENIKLNDHEPSHPKYNTLWTEVKTLQEYGIKILGMLGGAAKGTFSKLNLDDAAFESYYYPLKNLINDKNLDGLDLDVEEEISLSNIIRLIDRLKADFGNEFLITMAPVATALISDNPEHNLSGFSYEALEVMKGYQISWYNTQFYCGWGDMSNTEGFDRIISLGYPANKVVIGLVTNPENGSGWVPIDILKKVLNTLKNRYPDLGGVMGWEYFNSLPGGHTMPWKWAATMTSCIWSDRPMTRLARILDSSGLSPQLAPTEIDQNQEIEAPVPDPFKYLSENEEV